MKKNELGFLMLSLAISTLGACAVQSSGKSTEISPAASGQPKITTQRIDIVDEKGVVRMTLASPTPQPRIGGVSYPRAFNVTGLTYYDADGNERGGLGVADIEGGAAVVASDHEHVDAIGWRVMPNGEVFFMINEKPEVKRGPKGNVLPATSATSRLALTVAADGTPGISLNDKSSKPRVRLTVTPEGYGAIEFVNAQGEVVQTLAPERDLAKKKSVK